MKVVSKSVYIPFICVIMTSVIFAVGNVVAEEFLVFRGASDASAAVAIGENMFIVADDENNTLRVYKTDKGGLPVFSYDLTDFLDVEREYPEADIEGATRIGERIYWITSHGRNKDGEMRPSRYRFFATEVDIKNEGIVIRPAGKPYKMLIHKLLENETVCYLGLDKATRFNENLSKNQMEKLSPKTEGLNIEGICASADGKTIYIGFRNPRPFNKVTRKINALVVPLKNAAAILKKQESPIFGQPILWDLSGLGIRSMEYSPYHKKYFIVAGPHNEEPKFVLYCWSGEENMQPILVRQINSEKSKFSPEAIIPFENSDKLLLLSDDGGLIVKVSGPQECVKDEYRGDGTCLNKFLLDSNKKTFRGRWLSYFQAGRRK